MKNQNLGFTLIELLIVISLLGVLAVGLLATIDPFEQLKKGRDTSTRNMVEEFYNAALRYYAIKNSFPWGQTPASAVSLSSTPATAYLTSLTEAGELKQAFAEVSGLGNVVISSTTNCAAANGCEDLTVCFAPQSKAFRIDPNTKYSSLGSTAGITISPSCTTCYWCVR